jgi:menaquinone-dependent protoporphyrinogen oxidase
MARTLLLYSSVYGLSRKICERIADLIAARGVQPHVLALTDPTVDPTAYDAIVIGASIKHGKHHPSVLAFIRRHEAALSARPGALFSVSLVARKTGKNTPDTNPYLQALLRQSPWQPRLLGVFAGELDYSRYGPFDRQMMRFVMWINRGPTDPATRKQFTDWSEVERFAGRVAALSASSAPIAPIVSAELAPA